MHGREGLLLARRGGAARRLHRLPEMNDLLSPEAAAED